MKKIVLVTGAGRGLGWELTRQLTEKGYDVIMGVRDLEKGKAAWEQLQERAAAELVKLDMEDPATFVGLYDYIAKKYGHLDILVNNAGVMLDGDLLQNSTTTISNKLLRKTLEVNFFSIVELTNSLLPLLQKSGAASIINMSTNMGSLHLQATVPAMPKTFGYNTSKMALNAYTIHLADLLKGTNVKVNSIHPGWAKTDMGGEIAPLEIPVAVADVVALIEQGDKAPSGAFLYEGKEVPW